VWRPLRSGGEQLGTVFLQARHDLVARTLEYLGVLAVILTRSLIAALLLSNRLQNALMAPILAISDIARRIQRGHNFDLRATRTSEDEIGELVDVFNDMLDELGRRAKTLEQANRALRTSEERYQLAARGSSAGLWDWDMASDTMFYSPRFKALLGYSADEFPIFLVPCTHSCTTKTASTSAVQCATPGPGGGALPGRMPAAAEIGRVALVSRHRYVSKRCTRAPVPLAGSLIDVTERKRAEQVLQESTAPRTSSSRHWPTSCATRLLRFAPGWKSSRRTAATGHRRNAREHDGQAAGAHGPADRRPADISRINSGKILLETEQFALAAAIDGGGHSRPAIEARGHELSVELRDPASN
jgi:PAS domain-containing protein